MVRKKQQFSVNSDKPSTSHASSYSDDGVASSPQKRIEGVQSSPQKRSEQKTIDKTRARSIGMKRNANEVLINLEELSDEDFEQLHIQNPNREKDKERKKVQRMNENDQEKTNRQELDRERKRQRITNETEQERMNRQELNRDRMSQRIANETEQERMNRQELNKARMSQRIANETEQERMNRQELNRDRMSQRIANENEQERMNRQELDRERKRQRIMVETEQERINRQNLNRNRMREKRNNENCYACSNFTDVVVHKLGDMNIECIYCGSLNFPEEKVANRGNGFKHCCHYGKVMIENFPEKNFPVELKNFFTNDNQKSVNFFENIRRLNSCVSMASINPMRYQYPNNRGPYCFRIYGQIYHMMNTALHPDLNDQPAYGQLFIVDTGEAMHTLRHTNQFVDQHILKFVYELIKKVNPFAQSFVMMKEEEEKEFLRAEEEGREPAQIKLLFGTDKNMDKNRYKVPRANEVAVVFVPGADGEVPEAKIVVREKGKQLKILNNTDPNVTPMCYPLFFPNGTRGWYPGMKQIDGKKNISRLQYTSYCLAVRPNEFNPLLHGRKLFQQYCVDEYVKIEGDRIRWIKSNQKKILADSYRNVDSFLIKKSQETGLPIGRKVILPATITGSPRYIEKHFQDAMAMVRRFGKPDLFITMTCNPKWHDIHSNLFFGQDASSRPDIVDRVFYLKIKALMEEVKTKAFGYCIAWMYSVEFQLRGLPHIHLLLTMSQRDKVTTGNDVDKRGISARIPDKNEDPDLYELVKKHMIHGPCGVINPNCPCMIEIEDKNGRKTKKCSKNYPKKFQDETIVLENGFAEYARPKDERYVEIKTSCGTVHKLDNRWVVPHMPYLLKKFICHINVEKVNNVSSVKYLHKYIHKGPDPTGIELSEQNSINHDEAKQFIDARFVGPTDAIWRIMEFPICDRSHSIKSLPVHLVGEQLYYFDDDIDEEELRERIDCNSELMAYFELNKNSELAQSKYYHEIPEFFTFSKGIWKKRVGVDETNINSHSNSNTIGRLVKVLPSETERYYLRLLLLHVKGAQGFDDLRTINGNVYPTYAEACLALGLIRDDEEWKKAVEEANFYMMPSKLRMFFALILVHCSPTKPLELWLHFQDALSEDFQRKHSKYLSYELAYREIVKKINESGKNLADFPTLPKIDEAVDAIEVFDMQKELDIGLNMYNKMNDEQKIIFDTIMEKINEPTSRPAFFFISGAGGVGKTFLNKALCHTVKGSGKKYSTMAFTGIAANLLPGGRTLHNRFGLNLKMESSKISPNTKAWKELKETDLFIVDESPMIDNKALDVIDEKLKEIMQNDLLFGGKVMVWTGDFRQTLSIKKHATRAQIINSTIKGSKYWKYAIKLKLTKNMRTLENEIEFAKFLLDLGEGKLNDENDEVVLPPNCISQGDLAEEIFAHLILSENWENMSKSAILAPKNVDVTEINAKVLSMMPGEERYYPSIDHAENEEKSISTEYLDEYLNSLNPSGFPQHDLYLKQNSIIMLLRNLNICEGLCNGSRLRVQDMQDNVLVCNIIEDECVECNSIHKESIVFIPRITLRCEDEYPFSLVRHQFPVRLGFAFSIIKAQGQTLEKCGIDLRKNVFGHGQLYTGVSRVKSWNTLKVRLNEDNFDRKVINIVYKEVLDYEMNDE